MEIIIEAEKKIINMACYTCSRDDNPDCGCWNVCGEYNGTCGCHSGFCSMEQHWK